ncbi:unnamed protein product [Didymodactylos carnosus]|uniref:Reverse transcriptase domain-containing protein n=1 Tax=Didymodactylos carnosus TaxID=1234261 RepID=A0A815MGK1_9BILA|nr:unnamed protein product [Didymodactylos carnosus]CAF4301971.1 unnamed protein product [Didymodactylos carnosus]
MGSCLAPILADVFMIKLEQKLNKLSFNKPQLYLRYVDDVFCVFSKKQNYETFLNTINQWHQNIHFTVEVENNGQLPYLDVMIMRNSNDRRYDTTLYKKPTDTGLYLLYQSNQCRRYKLGLIKTLTVRILRICSTPQLIETQLKRLTDILGDNGYPSHIIRKGILEGKVIAKRLENPKHRKVIKLQSKLRNIFFTLPYFGEETFVLGQRIKKLCKQMIPTVDLKIAYKKTLTLKSIFLPIQKGLDESRKTKNIVYSIPCTNCDFKYFGETSRDINIRIEEHRYDVRRHAPNSKIVQHVHEKKHVMDFNNAITVAHETNWKRRTIKESLLTHSAAVLYFIFKTYYNFGCVMFKKENYEQALKNFQKAFNELVKRTDTKCDTIEKADIYNNIGCVYYRKLEYDKALENFRQAYKIALKISSSLTTEYLNNISATIRIRDESVISEHDNTVLALIDAATDSNQDFNAIYLNSSYSENDEDHTKLKRIFNNLKLFRQSWEYIRYLVQNKAKSQIILIVSNVLALQIISLVHDRPEILHIYIQCQNEQEQQYWTEKNYLKTRNKIFIDKNLLYEHLKAFVINEKDHEENLTYKKILPKLTYFNEKNDKNCAIKNLNKYSIDFIWFKLIIEILLKMTNIDRAKQIMIQVSRGYYRKYYRDNDRKENGKKENDNITEFELDQTTSDNAIRWYTRPCFCYRLTNKALYILYKQNHKDALTPIVLYRGKILSSITLQNLKDNIGGLVSMNGFISTTSVEQVADIYCSRDQQNSSNYEQTFFRLNIGINSQVPYASIQEQSQIPDEDEVLFSVGTVWRIKSVDRDEDKVWNIVLDLVAEYDQCCIELTTYLKEQLGEETTLLTLGNFLSELGEYEKAIRYYKILLNELPDDDSERGTIYNKLGYLWYEQGEYSLAEEYYRLAIHYLKDKEDEDININDNPFESINVLVSNSTNQLLAADSFPSSTTTTSRFRSFDDRIDLITKPLKANHSSAGKIRNNQGLVYYGYGDYKTALGYYEQARNLFEAEPAKNACALDLSAVYNNEGVIYFNQGKYQDALDSFEKAITTASKQFPSKHPWILDYIKNQDAVIKERQRT